MPALFFGEVNEGLGQQNKNAMTDPIRASKQTSSTSGLLVRALTPRAFTAGIIAMILTVFIVAWAELVTGQIQIGFLQLPPVIIALLFIISLVNRGLGRINQSWMLTTHELVVVTCMMLMASMVTSRGLMEDLIPIQAGLNYYANPTNKWEDTFFAHVKPWMVPWDPRGGPLQDVTVGYFEGLKAGRAIPWQPWIMSTSIWLILVAFVFAAFLALSTFLQKLWADHELLSFPLVQLPVEMIRDAAGSSGSGPSFLHNKMMWLGFAVPAVIFTFNGLHMIYPQIPQFMVQLNLNQYFTAKPWSDLGYMTLFFSLAAIGLFYLLPSEVLLSLWAFFLIARAQEVIVSMFGIPMPGMPHAGVKLFVGYQTVGCYLALVGYMVWASWPRIVNMMQSATRRQHDPTEKDALMPLNTALIVLAVSFIGILVFSAAMGMDMWVAVLEFGIYIFVQAIIMARSTSEAGMPMTEGSFTPMDVLGIFTHKRILGVRNLTSLAFLDAIFTRDLRGLVLTGFLDGQKMADQVKMPRRNLVGVFVFALVFSVILAAAISIYLPYQRGGVTMYYYTYQAIPTQFWNENAPFTTGQESFTWRAPIWTAVGIGVSLMLSFLRRQYVWWPLNPLGYALSASWTTTVFWFPMLVAWIIKSILMRYGGISAYRAARPIFLGLVFGEFTMAAIWTLISCIFRTQAPFFPWP